ncbi:MAG: glycosyltransferase family 2 protein [Chloroflexi bacterium]|nr:glycosyltransferase family 2 protein [Chloroflexota bacterium]
MGIVSAEEDRVTVIIVTYNNAAVLPACLDSLAEQTLPPAVIVVDNASSDGTVDEVRRRPYIRLVSLDSNRGFSAANNRGCALVATPFVLFLNPDTCLQEATALEHLVRFLRDHPRIGAAAPRLVWPDGTIQPYAFGDDPTLWYICRRALCRLLKGQGRHDWATPAPQRVDWVAGTCLLARGEAVRAIGGWDESFFLYFEDNDLCRRLRTAGWEVWYNPTVQITHLGGQADYQDIPRRRLYYKSMLRYYRKHEGLLAWAILAILLRPYLWLTGMAGSAAV